MARTMEIARGHPVRPPPKRNTNHTTSRVDQIITPMNKYRMKLSDLRGKRYFRAGMFKSPTPPSLPKIRVSACDKTFPQPKCSEDFANIVANHFKVERIAGASLTYSHKNTWKSPFVTIWDTRAKAEKFELNKWFRELEQKDYRKDTSDEWKSCRMLGNFLAENEAVVFDADDLRERLVAEGIWSEDTVNEDETDGCFLVWKRISRKAVESSQDITIRRQRDLCIELGIRPRYGPWKRGRARRGLPENNDSGNEEHEEEDDDQDLDQDSNEDLGGDQDEDTDEELDLEEDAGEDLDEDEDGNQGGDDQDSHEDLDENHNQDSGEESDQDSNEDANDGDTAAEESDSEWSWISNTAPEIRARRSYSKPRIETVEEANSDSGSQENEFYKGYGF
ncbi:hypothetical protein B0J14DRAFT_654212 [Halenospora varia]|nr:hypothetical protein B0J14DRAFT_654212 [Halenospora varia]